MTRPSQSPPIRFDRETRISAPTPDAPETVRALAANARFADALLGAAIVPTPFRGLAVLTCMDARIDVHAILGLQSGEAHVIRNAGGLATDDAIRSLVVSQHLLGTRELLVIEHTRCGMLQLDQGAVEAAIAETTGIEVEIPLHAFEDLEANLTEQVARIRAHPGTRALRVTGLVYDVDTGRLAPLT